MGPVARCMIIASPEARVGYEHAFDGSRYGDRRNPADSLPEWSPAAPAERRGRASPVQLRRHWRPPDVYLPDLRGDDLRPAARA
jgi:hypothetical protein